MGSLVTHILHGQIKTICISKSAVWSQMRFVKIRLNSQSEINLHPKPYIGSQLEKPIAVW